MVLLVCQTLLALPLFNILEKRTKVYRTTAYFLNGYYANYELVYKYD